MKSAWLAAFSPPSKTPRATTRSCGSVACAWRPANWAGSKALRFALEALAPGSLLAGAHIDIEQPDGQAWCLDCASNVPLIQRGAPCPQCGGFWLQANGGTELRILDLQVEDH